MKADAAQIARDKQAAEERERLEREQEEAAREAEQKRLQRNKAQWKADAAQIGRDKQAAEERERLKREQEEAARKVEQDRLERNKAQWKADAVQIARDKQAAEEKERLKREQEEAARQDEHENPKQDSVKSEQEPGEKPSVSDKAASVLVVAAAIFLPNIPSFFLGKWFAVFCSEQPLKQLFGETLGLPLWIFTAVVAGIFGLIAGVLMYNIGRLLDRAMDSSAYAACSGFLIGFRFFSGLSSQSQPSAWSALEAILIFVFIVFSSEPSKVTR